MLIGSVLDDPTRTLIEHQRLIAIHAGKYVATSIIDRELRRHGISCKRLSRAARERDPIKRFRWQERMGAMGIDDEAGVVIDEMSFDGRVSGRRTGWAPQGQRAEVSEPFAQGKRYSVLAALTTRGVKHVKIVEGAFCAAEVFDFVVELIMKGVLLSRDMGRGRWALTLDNASVHKSEALRDLVETNGSYLNFLPRYSPDYTPIELVFGQVKARMRRERTSGLEGIWNAFGVNEEAARGSFRHAGWAY